MASFVYTSPCYSKTTNKNPPGPPKELNDVSASQSSSPSSSSSSSHHHPSSPTNPNSNSQKSVPTPTVPALKQVVLSSLSKITLFANRLKIHFFDVQYDDDDDQQDDYEYDAVASASAQEPIQPRDLETTELLSREELEMREGKLIGLH